ncbi:MAG: hypothetical protein JOS17DRAFT_739279 [Linnemannia elongata]|nr:MAG: hypothetical protein JOS17DRAFT_739279 [Linnemannia elongata]
MQILLLYTTCTTANTINIFIPFFSFFLSTTLCTYYYFSYQHIQHLYLYSFRQEGTANGVRVIGRSMLLRISQETNWRKCSFLSETNQFLFVHDRQNIHTLDKPTHFLTSFTIH